MTETKTCQNCHNQFPIEPEDFDFYKKIDVPPPTFCPKCRLQRKMARRNERNLHKRTCDFCHADMISMYPKGSAFRVYCNVCWWSDGWDPLEYGREYDFSKPFFEQFYELSLTVPRAALYQKNAVHSPYANHSDHPRDCYFCCDTGFSENALYGKWIINCRDLMDSYGVMQSELVYELNECDKCSRSMFLLDCSECIDSAFLYDCRGCQRCFMSSNLRNKKHVFMNRQLSKEEYEKNIAEITTEDFQTLERFKKQFRQEIAERALHKFITANKIVNATGDYLFECKDVKESFHVYESEHSAYSTDAANLKDCYDAYEPAFNCERQYDCHAGNRLSYSNFCSVSYDNHHLEYSEMCHGSSFLFGCLGLRDKNYCVLNKQYAKEEYEKITADIHAQMERVPYVDNVGRAYRHGEFFPVEHSPFAYNETVAQEYYPLEKEEALRRGFAWREPESRAYRPTKKAEDTTVLDESILNEVFACAHEGTCREQCTTAFRIVPEELVLYKRMKLPVPALCPNCRYAERIAARNPLTLWHRACQCNGEGAVCKGKTVHQNVTAHFHGKNPCPNEFETSYAPERSEIVYCEACYQSEIV